MFEGLSFMMKGALISLLGLGGTFLVLVVIFVAVSLMRRIGRKKDDGTPQANQ